MGENATEQYDVFKEVAKQLKGKMLFTWVNTIHEWHHQTGKRFAELMYVKIRGKEQEDPFQLRVIIPSAEHDALVKYAYDGDASKMTAKKMT